MGFPLSTVVERRAHKVAEITFAQGRVSCGGCGVEKRVPLEPAFDRDERLNYAWMEHRREASRA